MTASVELETELCVGREGELAEIPALLANPDCRLLTIVGPGGAGKTCLAMEVASRERGKLEWPDGVWFVPLEPPTDAAFLASAITDTLGFPLQGLQHPARQLLDYVADKQMLLVLDSLEQAADSIDLLSPLLDAGPGLKILATSRATLNLLEERVFNIHGLTVPDDDSDEVEHSAAVRLFVNYARRAHPDFTLTPADRPYVLRICRLVQGLPLGIELAAGWTGTLSCAELANELEQSRAFLDRSGGERGLSGVLEHSWSLLSEEERRVFRQLIVFRGGLRREAAKSVVDASLEVLASLLAKSLLQLNSSGRYERSLLVWQFGNEKLAQDKQEEAIVRERHARYYAAFLAARRDALHGARQRETLAEIDEEIDNVRAAWRWAIMHRDLEMIQGSQATLAVFYSIRGWYLEGLDVFARAMAVVETAPPNEQTRLLRGSLLAQQGFFAVDAGRQEEAEERLRQAATILRTINARPELANVLNGLGLVAARMGEYGTANQYHNEALAVARSAGDRWIVAKVLAALGNMALRQGKYSEARLRHQENLAIFRELGDRMAMAGTLNNLGYLARAQGNLTEARQILEESLALAQESSYHRLTASVLASLGELAHDAGDYQEAMARFEQSLPIYRQIGSRRDGAVAQVCAGNTANALSEYQLAQQHFSEALQLAVEIRAAPVALGALIGWAELRMRTGDFAESREILSLILRYPALGAEDKVRAQQLVTQIETEQGAEQVAATQPGSDSHRLVAYIQDILGVSLPHSLAELFELPEFEVSLNETKLVQQVSQITESEFFRQLHEKASRLRGARVR